MIFFLERTARFVWNKAANLRWSAVYRQRVRINRSVYINPAKRCRFGSNLSIDTGTSISSELPTGWLHCSDDVQINRDVALDITGGLRIGAGTTVSSDVIIYTHSHGKNPRSKPEGFEKDIGTNVWIGSRAVILPSVRRISDGAIIGTGAVVTRDVNQNEIVAGNPARTIGKSTTD